MILKIKLLQIIQRYSQNGVCYDKKELGESCDLHSTHDGKFCLIESCQSSGGWRCICPSDK